MAEVSSVSSMISREPGLKVRSELDDSFLLTVPETAVHGAEERVSFLL